MTYTNPGNELRQQIASRIETVERAGKVMSRQIYTPDWASFEELFSWRDPADPRTKWVRAWTVMPSQPVATLREQTYGMGDVQLVHAMYFVVRGVHSMNEASGTYEDFNDVAWDVYMSLSAKRSYTLTEGTVTIPPGVELRNYANRRIADVACNTAEILVTITVDSVIDLD